jgi:DNA-directed RNA polymerase subunit RPC12/RpoP
MNMMKCENCSSKLKFHEDDYPWHGEHWACTKCHWKLFLKPENVHLILMENHHEP